MDEITIEIKKLKTEFNEIHQSISAKRYIDEIIFQAEKKKEAIEQATIEMIIKTGDLQGLEIDWFALRQRAKLI